MTSLTRSPIGVVLDDPELRTMLEAAVHETIAVGRARQIPLSHNLYEEVMQGFAALPKGTKASMLEDLERQRPIELPWLSGAVVRIGEEVGVRTPTHRLITTILTPHVSGGAGVTAR
jgi:2-dehydropantoate 2-reductase